MIILELHLCGPKGDGLREELDRALALVQLDNEFVIQAMLRAGRPVPDLIEDTGLPYRPPNRREAETNRQPLHGLRAMLENGWWSCGDAGPWEAAVLSVKYNTPTRAFSLPVSDDGLSHAAYRTGPNGVVVDPVARYLAKTGQPDYVWEALRA